MAKRTRLYICQSCGSSYPKWAGRCENCGEWNSINEDLTSQLSKNAKALSGGRKLDLAPLDGPTAQSPRIQSGMAEFDRVSGGGLVPGSALLLGGDPGVGKSTLLLQMLAQTAQKQSGVRCIYISGEEAIDQVRLRARRMKIPNVGIELAASTSVADIVATLISLSSPGIVIIDSIQTMHTDTIESAPGTVSQVRSCAQELINLAKNAGFCIVFVGHVTKEGLLAGPKVLEHMVDGVLSFEGERGHQFRILRTVKNRFGPTDEIGVFEMQDKGLVEVHNPSSLFLGNRQENISGASIFAGVEGTRPVLVEIQALIASAPHGTPRRAVVGWDSGRLSMVLAVLEARCGLSFSDRDVYLSVAGGYKVSEPAADLAVAMAIISAMSEKPIMSDSVVFGEIGLSGEIRPVQATPIRLKEASKLGFKTAYMPLTPSAGDQNKSDMTQKTFPHIRDVIRTFALHKNTKNVDQKMTVI